MFLQRVAVVLLMETLLIDVVSGNNDSNNNNSMNNSTRNSRLNKQICFWECLRVKARLPVMGCPPLAWMLTLDHWVLYHTDQIITSFTSLPRPLPWFTDQLRLSHPGQPLVGSRHWYRQQLLESGKYKLWWLLRRVWIWEGGRNF